MPNFVQAPIHAHIGQHLMEVHIGTPPIKITGVADTGSDLIWTNCVPCDGCYKQINPLFDPQKSCSYNNFCYSRSSKGGVSKGNMLIDSGTPPIYMPHDLYDRVTNEVRNKISMESIIDDPSLDTQLCYKTNSNLNGPNLTFHFENANVVLTPIQTFVPPKEGVFCLAINNQTEEEGIYGNFAQSNYLIGFDIEKELISFKQMDCIQH
ncbi:unnamed protein product [Vicia faba]|uniref:Peptidase A1 domain-containing protein n=1 Tax=Vicia faba TaxID=3906 RepID=A0AAV0YXZ8_VICFA|nr:unnamed protein product [Vicia faba]